MKKTVFVIFCPLFIAQFLCAQNVGIGTTTPHVSAQLDIDSNSKDLLMPGMNRSVIIPSSILRRGPMVYDSAFPSAGKKSSADRKK